MVKSLLQIFLVKSLILSTFEIVKTLFNAIKKKPGSPCDCRAFFFEAMVKMLFKQKVPEPLRFYVKKETYDANIRSEICLLNFIGSLIAEPSFNKA